MQGAGGGGDEPSYTRRKIREFLCIHTAYELIPESGKVIMLDADLPMRQGFHALHEQVSLRDAVLGGSSLSGHEPAAGFHAFQEG